jgi:D-3-phosphoglycerate dehydrogenase
MAEYKIVRVDRSGSQVKFSDELEALAGLDVEFYGADAVTEDEIIKALKDADAAITSSAVFTRKVFENLPKLRAVIRTGVGYDTIDVQAATDNGILLVNNPAQAWCAEEVSNQAILLMLACAKKLVKLHNLTISGEWRKAQAAVMPCECIHGQTAGIIGCGAIGRAIVKKALAFDMRVIVFDPYVTPEAARKLGVESTGLPALLSQADYVLVQTPLTNETFHLLGEQQFNLMKPSAFIINCARGECIDEPALIRALEQGKITGAGLDVFENEPPKPDNPLFTMDNVVVSPHCASWSTMAFRTMNKMIGVQAAQILRKERPDTVVNSDCVSKFGICRV